MTTYKFSWIIPCECSSKPDVTLAYNSNNRYRMPHGVEIRYYLGLGGTWFKCHVMHCVICETLCKANLPKNMTICPAPLEENRLTDVWW